MTEHESRRWYFTPFIVRGSHRETAQRVFCRHQYFLVSSTRGVVGRFLLIHLPGCYFILFDPGLSWAVFVTSIMEFFSTVVASDVIQISPGSLLVLFSIAFVVPSFTALRKHELVAYPVLLEIYIRVIIRLIF